MQAGDTAVFAFTARLPGSGATATFQGEEIYVGYERTGEFPLEVTLAGAGLTPSPAADDDASPWGAVATAVAVVGLLMLALVFLLVACAAPGEPRPDARASSALLPRSAAAARPSAARGGRSATRA